jgi:hypothetical protein
VGDGRRSAWSRNASVPRVYAAKTRVFLFMDAERCGMPRVNGAHTVSHCRCTGAQLVAGVPREMLKPYGFVSTPTLVIADAEWKVRER